MLVVAKLAGYKYLSNTAELDFAVTIKAEIEDSGIVVELDEEENDETSEGAFVGNQLTPRISKISKYGVVTITFELTM